MGEQHAQGEQHAPGRSMLRGQHAQGSSVIRESVSRGGAAEQYSTYSILTLYRTSGVIFFIDYCTAIRDT
jgi:hypothetical protein